MHGLMMDLPLTITSIMRHAEKNHPNREIVSITADHPLHRTTYGETFRRTRQLANALASLGVEPGDRVATLAWNDFRHFELYYAISCSGAVCHTINPRLFDEQVIYIANHAEDQWIFTDVAFISKLEGLQSQLSTTKGFVVMVDEAHMPETSLSNVKCYETLLAAESDEFQWPDLDERTASALCYTSGTTGAPKGVLYNHRSTVLHSYSANLRDVMGFQARDNVLPIVPMFHANAWGVNYAPVMVGAKLVLPGPQLGDGETLQRLIDTEQITVALGVPTVWLALLAYLEKSGKKIDSLERTFIGGSSCPRAMIDQLREDYGVYVHHAWGMTEMSPLGTFNSLLSGMDTLSQEALGDIQAKQGRVVYGVDMKIVDDDDKELPWDGEAFGALKVRGPFVCQDYFKQEGSNDAHDDEGWFDTGDVATIDALGYMQITDRTKDVIKSGGEWISSIDLENTALAHPQVAEAAVIGVNHPKWAERPLLVVVKKTGESPTKQELIAWFEGKVAKWWIPDDVAFVDELPHTATGKLSKVHIREQFADYVLGTTVTESG